MPRSQVREAEDKEPTRAAERSISRRPTIICWSRRTEALSLSNEEPVLYSRPSIDVLFETAADAYGPALIGVVLTGANQDGAQGPEGRRARPAATAIVQNPGEAFRRDHAASGARRLSRRPGLVARTRSPPILQRRR